LDKTYQALLMPHEQVLPKQAVLYNRQVLLAHKQPNKVLQD
jgi:hypothetical protein